MDVLLIPDFVPDHAALLAHLSATLAWDERMKARRTASFGVPYDYSGITYPFAEFPPEILAVKRRVDERLGYPSNNCLVNLYADGKSALGYHSDHTAHLEPASSIAIISLGATRRLVFRGVADPTRRESFALPGGSMLVMSLAMQREWEHGLPRDRDAGPRIGLTFRRFRD